MKGESNDLLIVLLWPFPGYQDRSTGEQAGGQPLRSAGQAFPHYNHEPASSTGHPQVIFCHTLVVASIIQPNLVDHQSATTLNLHPAIGQKGLAILHPVDAWRRFSFCFADKPGSASASARDGFRSLRDGGGSWEGKELSQHLISNLTHITDVDRRATSLS